MKGYAIFIIQLLWAGSHNLNSTLAANNQKKQYKYFTTTPVLAGLLQLTSA